MSDEKEKKGLQQFTCKVYPDVKESLSELMESGDFKTQNQMIETLIETYNFPKKADEKNAKKIIELQQKNDELIANYDTLQADFIQLQNKYNELLSGNSSSSEQIKQLQEQLEVAKTNLPGSDTMVIPMDNYRRKVLEVVAERENEKRNRNDITPEILLLFIMDEIIINCNAFEFSALSGKEKRRIKEELAAESKSE